MALTLPRLAVKHLATRRLVSFLTASLLATAPGLGVPRRQIAHIHLDDITFNFSRRHPQDATVASVAHFGHGAIADIALRWLALHPGAVVDPPTMLHAQTGSAPAAHDHTAHDVPPEHAEVVATADNCFTGDGLPSECPAAAIRSIDEEFFAELAAISSLEPPRIDPPTPRSEVGQEDVSPVFAGAAPAAIDMIDWTHGLHEVLYDILATPEVFAADDSVELPINPPIQGVAEQPRFSVRSGVPRVFAVALDDYYKRSPLAISPAPLETVILERAELSSQPWFRYYRTNFVQAYGYFMLAHWWHPSIYETQMLFPELAEQQAAVIAADRTLARLIAEKSFPQMMVLSREISPRFTSLVLPTRNGDRAVGAEAGNVFDNLHMLHGIVYDILSAPIEQIPALEKEVELWRARGLDLETEAAKPGRAGRTARRAVWRGRGQEVRRMVEILRYRPGDEKLAAGYKNYGPFNEDPTVFVDAWMKTNTGRDGEHCAAMMRSMGHCGTEDEERDPHARH